MNTGRIVAVMLINGAVIIAAGAALAAHPKPQIVGGSAPVNPPIPQMTADQAILIARDYCKRIGQPVTEVGTATFPAPAHPIHDPPEPDGYWLPRWKVIFINQADLDVVDETGIVSDYHNQVWAYNLSPLPDGPEITAEQAEKIATDALRSTGQSMDELVFRAVDPDSSVPPNFPDRAWGVGFDRVFHGVRYRLQGAGALVQYRGGRVDRVSIGFPSPPAVPSVMHFDADHAAQKALERLSQRGAKEAVIYAEDLKYIVPDHSSPDGDPPTQVVAPRLAWVATAGTGSFPTDESIDAETGDVIAEQTYMPAGRLPVPKGIKTAAEILADAKEVKIVRRTDKYVWPEKPTSVLSPTSQPKMFELLKASEPSSIKDLLAAPEFKLVVTTSDKQATTLYYLPDRNLVGNGVDWLTAPAGFQTWTAKLGGKSKMK